MLNFLPLIAGLLQGKQQDAAAKKQNAVNAYMGQAPTASTGNTGAALTGALGGLLQSKGGGDKQEPLLKTGMPRYDDQPPLIGGGGMSRGTDNLLGDEFGGSSVPNDDDLLGAL